MQNDNRCQVRSESDGMLQCKTTLVQKTGRLDMGPHNGCFNGSRAVAHREYSSWV